MPPRRGIPVVDHLEHDAAKAWRRGPRRAFAEISAALGGPAAGVVTTAMVPSITAVDRRGTPDCPACSTAMTVPARTAGTAIRWPGATTTEASAGRARMLVWAAGQLPEAAGYWPSQAVATHALCGVPAMDSAAATTFGSLVPNGRWDRVALAAIGIDEAGSPGSSRSVGPPARSGARRPWSAVGPSTPSASRSWPGPTSRGTSW